MAQSNSPTFFFNIPYLLAYLIEQCIYKLFLYIRETREMGVIFFYSICFSLFAAHLTISPEKVSLNKTAILTLLSRLSPADSIYLFCLHLPTKFYPDFEGPKRQKYTSNPIFVLFYVETPKHNLSRIQYMVVLKKLLPYYQINSLLFMWLKFGMNCLVPSRHGWVFLFYFLEAKL